MKKRRSLKRGLPNALLAGILVWVLCMGVTANASWAAADPAPARQDGGTGTPQPEATAAVGEIAPVETVAPGDCAACHPNVDAAWSTSPHAHAFDDEVFVERWKSLGQPEECLACHTTGYTANTGEYTAEGVTCESCHGPVIEDHPKAVVPVRADTEYCGTCHTTTLGEWRQTRHASEDVGCTDCHNPHSQAALFEDPDEMCINCHKDTIGEHQNDTHLTKGIGCVDCHALVLPPDPAPADGLVPTGHSFKTSSTACVACHTDTLQVGRPLPGYEEGAKAVAAGLPVTTTQTTTSTVTTGAASPASLSEGQMIQVLEAALANMRLSSLFQGGIVGLVLGGSTAYFVARNQRREQGDEEKSETGDSQEGQDYV